MKNCSRQNSLAHHLIALLSMSIFTLACGGSMPSSGGGGSGTLKQLGDSCTCGGSSTHSKCRSSSGPCEPQLTCFTIGSSGDCTKECSSNSDCGSGFSCQKRTLSGANLGMWCE